MVQAQSCKIDGRMQFGELMQLFWGDCRRVLGGLQFGVVVQVLFRVAVGGAADRVGLFPR